MAKKVSDETRVEEEQLKLIRRKAEKKKLRELKSYYQEAEKITEKLFKNLPPDIFSTEKTSKDNEESAKKKVKVKSSLTFCGEKMSRHEAIKTLEERLSRLKGQKLSYREKLVKKGLKVRIKKKQRQELRKLSKGEKFSKLKKLKEHQADSNLLLESESAQNDKSFKKERKKKLKKNETKIKNSENTEEEQLKNFGSHLYLLNKLDSEVEYTELTESDEVRKKKKKKTGKNQVESQETEDEFQRIGGSNHLPDIGENTELNNKKRNKRHKKKIKDEEEEFKNGFLDKKANGKVKNNSASECAMEMSHSENEDKETEEISGESEKLEKLVLDPIETKPIIDSEGRVYKSKKEMKRAMKEIKKQEKKRMKRKEIKMMKKKRKNEVLDDDPVEMKENKVKRLCGDFENIKLENDKNLKMETKVCDLMFNKFDFVDSENSIKRKGIKDPKRALQVLEKTNNRIKHLKMTGREEKAERIKERVSWSRAIEKAEGVRVKDDVELIKKSIRRKEGLKNRSKKKWDERNSQLKQKMEEAQKKRRDNIMAKKKEKKQKKMKRAIKKGRIVP